VIKTALLNGSPRGERSASRMILDFMEELLPKEQYERRHFSLKTPNIDPTVLGEILSSQVLLIAFPLYVDGVPSHMIRWLMELERVFSLQVKSRPSVYALVNCGFYEADQTRVTLDILRNWCERAGLKWGQGMGIGAGGAFSTFRNTPMGKWPFRDLGGAMTAMGLNITKQVSGTDLFVSPDFPRVAYKVAVEYSWRRAIKHNGLKLRDLHRRIPLVRP